MDTNNPNNMSNQDLEKDMQKWDNDLKGNQENVNRSTATEGELMTPEQDINHKAATDYVGDEKDLDKKVHEDGGEDGSVPDSEELSLDEEEDGYDDSNKISS